MTADPKHGGFKLGDSVEAWPAAQRERPTSQDDVLNPDSLGPALTVQQVLGLPQLLLLLAQQFGHGRQLGSPDLQVGFGPCLALQEGPQGPAAGEQLLQRRAPAAEEPARRGRGWARAKTPSDAPQKVGPHRYPATAPADQSRKCRSERVSRRRAEFGNGRERPSPAQLARGC